VPPVRYTHPRAGLFSVATKISLTDPAGPGGSGRAAGRKDLLDAATSATSTAKTYRLLRAILNPAVDGVLGTRRWLCKSIRTAKSLERKADDACVPGAAPVRDRQGDRRLWNAGQFLPGPG
jgi:hypothetical protein